MGGKPQKGGISVVKALKPRARPRWGLKTGCQAVLLPMYRPSGATVQLSATWIKKLVYDSKFTKRVKQMSFVNSHCFNRRSSISGF